MKQQFFKKALVSLDLSEADDSILGYLDFWSQKVAVTQLHFLHVVRKAGNWFGWRNQNTADQWVLNEDVLKEMQKDVAHKLTHAAHLSLSYELAEGDPLGFLLDSIAKHHADLVVVGRKTDPHTNGAMARNVVRKAPCPVLVVPQGFRPELKTIVVPIDFSEYSARALKAALQINELLEKPAQIVALHVYELPDVNYYRIQKTEQQLRSGVRADVQEALNQFIQHHVGNLYDLIQTRLEEHSEGAIAHSLLVGAKEAEADLVVMGAKGHSLVERLLMGSVTEHFLQDNDSICTLIVR